MDISLILDGAFPGSGQRVSFLRCCVNRAARSDSFDLERHIQKWEAFYPLQVAITAEERKQIAHTLWFIS